ncbi:MAG: hypothetical protein DRP51_00260 [Candidatus Zixiibacteriota bacterium]|nr:MAG: hypothetical protein DRP51_00260 [candidate division Zixibacteria bacterium]HHI02698.1 hypothetical protein [candidate division Zixibacteria bacterium]
MTALETLAELAPLFVIFPVAAYIIKMSLDYFTRKHMIEKGLIGEEAAKMFRTNSEVFLPSSLKWGLVLTFVGVVIVILQILPVYVSSEVYFGVMLIAAGAAMLIYYGLASMKAKENKKNQNE